MCVCIYTILHGPKRMFECTRVLVCGRIHICVCMCAGIYVYIYLCICVFMYICMYAFTLKAAKLRAERHVDAYV